MCCVQDTDEFRDVQCGEVFNVERCSMCKDVHCAEGVQGDDEGREMFNVQRCSLICSAGHQCWAIRGLLVDTGCSGCPTCFESTCVWPSKLLYMNRYNSSQV